MYFKLKEKFDTAEIVLNRTLAKAPKSSNENGSTNLQRITETFDALRKMINDCEETLKKQVRAIEEQDKPSLDNYLAITKRKQKELSGCNTQFETILSSNDHTLLLEGKNNLITFLDQLMNELQALKPPFRTECRLEGIDQLHTNVENLLKPVRVGE